MYSVNHAPLSYNYNIHKSISYNYNIHKSIVFPLLHLQSELASYNFTCTTEMCTHVLAVCRSDPFCDNEVAGEMFGCTQDRGSIARCNLATLPDDVIADYRV